MARIQKLPESLANKIAAGEVVQRPESVVKELVENSLDAGATEVAVTVKNAGKSLIYVNDNGSGMSEDDARTAFLRHATSKISTVEDLDRILTLGFRGEAMAAIASVAQVELKTRQAEDELGTLVRVENGEILETAKTACEQGTSISVKNLFFSVPARRKFLKSNATEFKHIVEVMQRFALCYPDVAFTLSDDSSLVLNVQRGTMEDRIRAIYNDEMVNALIPLEAEADGLKVTGYIGKPNFARKSKSDQYLFLNGRYIVSRLLSHGIFTGYEHLLDAQSYPPYLIFLEVDPERVDVNVHPTKAEVKFDDEHTIYTILQDATRKALSEHNLIPSMMIPEKETGEGVLAALKFALPGYERSEKFSTGSSPAVSRSGGGSEPREQEATERPAAPRPTDSPFERRPDGRGESRVSGDLFRQLFGERQEPLPSAPIAESAGPMPEESVPPTEADAVGAHEISIPQEVRPVEEAEEGRVNIWQVHNKYILSQIRSGIMIIDQHVAHERILYERALRRMEAVMPMSQQLLFPLELKMTLSEYTLVRELRSELSGLGFEISVERGEKVVIQGVPNDVRPGQEAGILRELLDQYQEYQQMGKTDQRDMLAASFACRASIKAGDPLSQEEMLNLIEELFLTSMPYVCPHGRPIVIRVDLTELDRRFGRTS